MILLNQLLNGCKRFGRRKTVVLEDDVELAAINATRSN
jgi:hypothetical protein